MPAMSWRDLDGYPLGDVKRIPDQSFEPTRRPIPQPVVNADPGDEDDGMDEAA